MSEVLEPSLVRIPGGAFRMGALDGHDNERPVRDVTLSPFQLGSHPVTNAEYGRFVRATGHPPPAVRHVPLVVGPDQLDEFLDLAARFAWAGHVWPPETEAHPVVLVTFEDARDYCRWLAKETGHPYRLPTEAEWEKAARGGLDGALFPWGNDFDPSRASYLASGSTRTASGTRPVGSFPPNGYGLFDMAGNVWEWVADWYRLDYYGVAEAWNPLGPTTGTMRLVRGGSWTNANPDHLRCACRMPVPPDTYCYSMGFRVACDG